MKVNKYIRNMVMGITVATLTIAMPMSANATENESVEAEVSTNITEEENTDDNHSENDEQSTVEAEQVNENTVEQDNPDNNGITPMEGTYYVSTQMGLNVRNNPSTSAEKMGILEYGQAVSVKGFTQDGWFLIDYNGTTGYIASRYMSDKPVEIIKNDNPDNTSVQDDQEIASSETSSETETKEEVKETEVSGIEVMSGGVKALFIILSVALFGLIGFTAYKIFKDNDKEDDEYYEDEYADNGYYEDEYYEDEYEDDEYYEDEYADNEYYEDEYYEDEYADDEYYEEENHSDKY